MTHLGKIYIWSSFPLYEIITICLIHDKISNCIVHCIVRVSWITACNWGLCCEIVTELILSRCKTVLCVTEMIAGRKHVSGVRLVLSLISFKFHINTNFKLALGHVSQLHNTIAANKLFCTI